MDYIRNERVVDKGMDDKGIFELYRIETQTRCRCHRETCCHDHYYMVYHKKLYSNGYEEDVKHKDDVYKEFDKR